MVYMFSKLYNYIFEKNRNFDLYKKEIEETRISTNVERCEKLGKVLFILNILLILVDLIIYKPFRVETVSYKYLFYSHILMFILILIWFILLKLHRNYNNFLSRKFLYHTLISTTMYWGVFLGLNGLYISGQITAYIVCVFSISACFYLTPLETFHTYFISLVTFIIGLNFIVNNTRILYSHIINATIFIVISCIISNLSDMSFSKDFINKKKLLESKMELEVTNQKLKEYEKLRSDFFANISHELRTPLNVIYCAHQMMDIALKQSGNNNYNINKYLKMIKQNSYRLLRLIGNLIDITKIDALSFDIKLVNTDIIKVVEDITMSVVTMFENKGLTLTFDTAVEEKIISCDPDKIERIMLNVISNAMKFTEKSGSIFVYIYLQDNKVCISIKDTGIGIPNDMKDLIFDRFIQVDKSISKKCEGSGIGLSLVQSLVELHGGSIHVDSKLGEGSEFIIMLPDTILTLTESEKVEVTSYTEEDLVKRIKIEFSDIYD